MLSIVASRGGVTRRELAEQLGVGATTVNRDVARLQREGLLVVESKLARALSLTRKGQAQLEVLPVLVEVAVAVGDEPPEGDVEVELATSDDGWATTKKRSKAMRKAMAVAMVVGGGCDQLCPPWGNNPDCYGWSPNLEDPCVVIGAEQAAAGDSGGAQWGAHWSGWPGSGDIESLYPASGRMDWDYASGWSWSNIGGAGDSAVLVPAPLGAFDLLQSTDNLPPLTDEDAVVAWVYVAAHPKGNTWLHWVKEGGYQEKRATITALGGDYWLAYATYDPATGGAMPGTRPRWMFDTSTPIYGWVTSGSEYTYAGWAQLDPLLAPTYDALGGFVPAAGWCVRTYGEGADDGSE